MQYIHIKNLDKYHPGYKDRNLIWCKVYFTMLNGDPEFEMLCEIDQWRFIKFIMLEIQSKKPVPAETSYLSRKGFNNKKRAISLTLQMLHNFLEVVTHNSESAYPRSREEIEIEIEKDNKEKEYINTVWKHFLLKTQKQFKLDEGCKSIIRNCFKEKRTVEDIKKAIDNFVADTWDGRKAHMDLVYCLGVRNKVDNYIKWVDKIPEPDQKEITYA